MSELKPIIIISQDPELMARDKLFSEAMDRIGERNKFLTKQFETLKEDCEKVRVEFWKDTTELLLQKGLIKDKDIPLSVQAGVIYEGHRNTPANMLSRLFGFEI